jgi:hypothetical protein
VSDKFFSLMINRSTWFLLDKPWRMRAEAFDANRIVQRIARASSSFSSACRKYTTANNSRRPRVSASLRSPFFLFLFFS